MTEAEIRQWVMNYCDGHIFTSADVEKRHEPGLIGMVFMPLMLGGLSELAPEDTDSIGLIWENMAAAGPRGVNGMPVFMSCRLMAKADFEIVKPLVNAELQRRAEYVKGAGE